MGGGCTLSLLHWCVCRWGRVGTLGNATMLLVVYRHWTESPHGSSAAAAWGCGSITESVCRKSIEPFVRKNCNVNLWTMTSDSSNFTPQALNVCSFHGNHDPWPLLGTYICYQLNELLCFFLNASRVLNIGIRNKNVCMCALMYCSGNPQSIVRGKQDFANGPLKSNISYILVLYVRFLIFIISYAAEQWHFIVSTQRPWWIKKTFPSFLRSFFILLHVLVTRMKHMDNTALTKTTC